MYEVITGLVYKVDEIQTKKQKAIVKTYFDQEFHIKLTTDKETINSDGQDVIIITANVYNYLDEQQTVDIVDIVFELDGEKQIVPSTNGQAEITFSTNVAGEYIIKTNIPNFRNDEIKAVAE